MGSLILEFVGEKPSHDVFAVTVSQAEYEFSRYSDGPIGVFSNAQAARGAARQSIPDFCFEGVYYNVSIDDTFRDMSKKQLKAACATRGLSKKGDEVALSLRIRTFEERATRIAKHRAAWALADKEEAEAEARAGASGAGGGGGAKSSGSTSAGGSGGAVGVPEAPDDDDDVYDFSDEEEEQEAENERRQKGAYKKFFAGVKGIEGVFEFDNLKEPQWVETWYEDGSGTIFVPQGVCLDVGNFGLKIRVTRHAIETKAPSEEEGAGAGV